MGSNKIHKATMGKDALQKRMEMPIGVKPAARVKRKGKPIAIPREIEDDEPLETLTEEESTQKPTPYPRKDSITTSQDSMSAVLGSVVERRRKGSSKKKMMPQATTRHSNGFPSLRASPVGTLVRPRARATPERKEVIISDDEDGVPADTTVGSMLKESKREAADMLNSMSANDIQQHAQELRTSLNPDLIAFLEQRGKGKTKGNNKSVSFVKPKNEPMVQPKPSVLDETLSSIRTYQDLDAAYETYIKEHSKDTPSGAVSENKDDFALACDLLRSTSPHQTLWATRCVAREVPQRQHVPKLLPISLRCLLDSSITAGKSSLQATYVLQSLYALVCKFACPEHVVDVTGRTMDAAAIYQLYYLDDGVPKPRIRSCYEAITAQSIATNEMGAAYTTQSSALSAQSDAEAFRKDPMWTLLSRTRILPRLATIARLSTSLPEEAWVSICGILSMLGQRSPGAATAILEHATLLPCLEERLMFERGQYQPSQSLPMVILYCTLSRQSRHAAKRIAERTNDKIVEILSLGESDSDWRLLHRWSLILWRTLLRYGYGASVAQPILTISTPILTLGAKGKDTIELATGFYTCYANLLKYASTCSLYSESKSPEETTSSINIDVLKQASLWLTSESSWRQALGHIQLTSDDLSPVACSFYASVLLFLKASLHHVIDTIGREAMSSTGAEIAGRMNELSQILLDFVDHQSFGKTFPCAVESAIYPRAIVYPETNDEVQAEAASAAIFASFSSLADYLSRQSNAMSASEICLESVKAFVLAWTQSLNSNVVSQRSSTRKTETIEMARLRWLNLSLTAILLSDMSMTPTTRKAGAFALIGRLQCGEEALFATVLNQSMLNDNSPTWLDTALATLLCGSKMGRSQLLHSRLILDRFVEGDITPSGSAPLDIKTLLSEATDAAVEDFLPLGDHWLWQLAAGSFYSGTASEAIAERENGEVMSAALGEIFHAECDEQSSAIPYANTFALGPKVFWMICVFLRGTTQDFGKATKILKRYTHFWTDSECAAFVSTCETHHVQQTTKPPDSEDSVDIDPAARKIVESNIPEASVRALEALINDVCDKFLLEGPEFSFGALCLRVFVASSFAPKIRCLVFQKLRETIHLLTHDDLFDNDALWLEACVAPGIETSSTRDPPEIIDSLVDLYAHGRAVRSDDCFVRNLAVLVLARNVILLVKTENQSSLRIMGKRLQIIDRAIATRVFMAVTQYLQTANAPVNALVRIVVGIENVVEAKQDSDVSLELASVIEQYRQLCR